MLNIDSKWYVAKFISFLGFELECFDEKRMH